MKDKEPRELLTAEDVRHELKISKEHAMQIMHAYGLRLGRRWYITSRQLDFALSDLSARGSEGCV